MTKRQTSGDSTNEGIQAHSIVADVLAVGAGSKAVKNELSVERTEQLQRATHDLEVAIATLVQSQNQRAVLAEDLESLRRTLAAPAAKPEAVVSSITSLGSKLKMIGVVIKDVAALMQPIQTIAAALHIPLKLLGL